MEPETSRVPGDELPRDGWRRQPWKNGRGVTFEIARWPEHDPFDVRVSLADDTQPATFSLFPGYVRWSYLAGEAPITLVDASGATVELARPGDHIRAAGETQLTSRLPAGATRMLTLLVRRELVERAEVTIGYGPTAAPVRFSFCVPAQRAWAYRTPKPLLAPDHVWIAEASQATLK